MASDPPRAPLNLMVALARIVQILEARCIDYALIGGIATGYRSRPRFTEDVDVLLQVPQLILPELLEDLHSAGFEFDLETAIREWTREHMTVLSFGGVRIDWLKPVLPCFQHVIDTAQPASWLGTTVRIASAEGLILLKLLSFRDQDRLDIQNLLAANRDELDLEFIRGEWDTVAGRDDPRLLQFEQMIRDFYDPS